MGFGNNMDLTRAPLVVLKDVRITIARAASSTTGAFDKLVLRPPFRIRMILVPQNKMCLAKAGEGSPTMLLIAFRADSTTGSLDTGMDSPVSIDSLTIASPDNNNRSAGKVCRLAADTSITSPGTSSIESTVVPEEHQLGQ